MPSVRKQIFDAAFARLQGLAPAVLPLANVVRNKAVGAESFPRINMRHGGHAHDLESETTGVDEYTLRFDVELYVKGADPDELLEALYDDVVIALCGGDITLGGLALWIRESDMGDPQFDPSDAKERYAQAFVGFTVRYWTKTNDPTQVGP